MRIVLVAAALLAALSVSAAVVLSRDGEDVDFRGSEAPADLTLPAFSLRDEQGRMVSSAQLRGKAVAVTFLDTQCTEACPVLAAQIGQAVRALGDRRGEVEALAISVDPRDDTRTSIDAFLKRYRARGALRHLDGTVAELRPVWDAFAVAVSYDTGSSNMHSAPVRVFDREGRWRSTLHPGVDLTPANLVHDLRMALRVS